MKKLFIILLTLAITNCLIAQKQYSLQRKFNSKATQFFHDENIYLLGQWQNTPGKDNIGLKQLVETTDSIQLKKILNLTGENSRLTHLIPKPEGGYVGIYYEQGCRYAAPGNFIFHLDDDFNITKPPIRIQYFFRNIRQPIIHAYFIFTNTLVLATKAQVTTFDIATRRAIAFNDSLKSYDYIVPLNNRFVCLEKNKFHILNVFCNVKGTQIIDFNLSQLIALKSGNGYFGIGKQRLAVLNNSGVVVFEQNWQSLSSSFDSLSFGFYSHDTLIVIGKYKNHWKLAKLTNQFDVISDASLGPVEIEGNGVMVNDILISGSKTYLLKAMGKGISKQHFLEVYNFNFKGNPTNTDLEIDFVSVDSITNKSSLNRLLNCEIHGSFTTTNNGPDTVRSFYVKWKSSSNNNCNGGQKGFRVYTNLAPNASLGYNLSVVDSFLVPLAGYDLCFEISAPNNNVDTIINNNSSCGNTILPPVSLSEIDKAFEIPGLLKSGNSFTIPNNIKAAYLIRANGQIHIMSLLNGTFVIPYGLSNGVYTLVFEAENARYRHRFLLFN